MQEYELMVTTWDGKRQELQVVKFSYRRTTSMQGFQLTYRLINYLTEQHNHEPKSRMRILARTTGIMVRLAEIEQAPVAAWSDLPDGQAPASAVLVTDGSGSRFVRT